MASEGPGWGPRADVLRTSCGPSPKARAWAAQCIVPVNTWATLVSKALALLVTEYRILVVSIVCGEQCDDSFGISQQCDSLV